MRSSARAEVRHEQRDVQYLEHHGAARLARDVHERGVDVGKTSPVAPYQLGDVDLDGGKHTDDQARQHRRQHDVAAGVFYFFRERRDAVEADVGERRDRRAGEDDRPREGLAVVERQQQLAAPEVQANQIARAGREKQGEHHEHRHRKNLVRPCARFHTAQVQRREEDREQRDPRRIRYAGQHVHGRLAAPDRADDRVQHVVHHHAPPGHVPEPCVELAADVGERRAGARIHARHPSVAHRREEHRAQADQDRRDDMAPRFEADDSEDAHRSDGLNEDDAVEHEVPQRQRAPQARSIRNDMGIVRVHRAGALFQASAVTRGRIAVRAVDTLILRASPGSSSK